MLSFYRVLDLTNEKDFLCGKALGDLGADALKIEKLGGDPSRNIGPFYHDIPDAEKCPYWFGFNANKPFRDKARRHELVAYQCLNCGTFYSDVTEEVNLSKFRPVK